MALGIGKLRGSEVVREVDLDTGACIERLTDSKCTCHHVYPTVNSTTFDGKFLLHFREVNRQVHRRQLYAMNLDTGVSMQLTSGEGIDPYQASFSADDKHVYYLQNNEIWRLDIRDLMRESAYRPERGWRVREYTFSSDGSYVVVVEISERASSVTAYDKDWSRFSLNQLYAPTCRIVRVDTISGERRVLVEQDVWIARPQQRPNVPENVLFCHEGPQSMIDARMWVVRADGSHPHPLREQGEDIIITSEFWTTDGRHVGYLCGNESGAFVDSVRACNVETGEDRKVMDCAPYAHCTLHPSGRFLVGDALSAYPSENAESLPPHDRPKGDDYIYIVDLLAQEEYRLCYHGSSWGTGYGVVQDAMPHPVFSRDGRYVIFVSDREGRPSIFRVDWGRFLWEREARVNGMTDMGLAVTFGPLEEFGALTGRGRERASRA